MWNYHKPSRSMRIKNFNSLLEPKGTPLVIGGIDSCKGKITNKFIKLIVKLVLYFAGDSKNFKIFLQNYFIHTIFKQSN